MYSEVTIVKDEIQGFMQLLLNMTHQYLKWRQQISWVSSPDCQNAMDKQRTQHLLLPKYKNGRCYKIIENAQIGMPRHLDSSTTTQMA